jgi:hypothetical protein
MIYTSMDILTDARVNELKKHTEFVGHCDTNLFDHLLGTYKILKENGKPEYLCWAGLFHSVYETEYVSFNTFYTREQVRTIIGERAENLVYIFCNLNPRVNKLLNREGTWSTQIYADLLDIEIANMTEQRYYNDAIKMLAAIRMNLKV